MTYDDIRFSEWDDPEDDDDDDDNDDDYDYSEDAFYIPHHGEDGADYIPMTYEDECRMCGKDRSLNHEGYCFSCWQVWNS